MRTVRIGQVSPKPLDFLCTLGCDPLHGLMEGSDPSAFLRDARKLAEHIVKRRSDHSDFCLPC